MPVAPCRVADTRAGQGFSGACGPPALAPGVGSTWGVYAYGNMGASGTKPFVEPHPYKAGTVIRYVALESPEAGTCFRGRGQLAGGRAVIEVEATRDVEFSYLVQSVRKTYRDVGPFVENTFFRPVSPDDRMPASLSADEKQRLVDNGTYDPDGNRVSGTGPDE